MEIAFQMFDEQEKFLKHKAAEKDVFLGGKEKSMRKHTNGQNELMRKKLQFLKELSIESRSSRTSKSMTSQAKYSLLDACIRKS